MIVPGTSSLYEVAVTGYSPQDVLAGAISSTFDFAKFPTLARSAPQRVHPDDVLVTNCVGGSFCPAQSWWASQGGTVAIWQNAAGQYILPDGSVWTGTTAVYAGANNSGPLQGYIYTGSNGSQWFAGAAHASTPETLAQFSRNMSALQAQVTAENCGGSGG